MAAVSIQQASLSLPAMRRDGGKRLMRRVVALWTGVTGAVWSVGTPDSAVLDTLALVADPVQLFEGMVEGYR